MLDTKCSISKSFCFDRICPEEAHCGTISTDLDIQELLSLGKVQEAENDLRVLSPKKPLKFCFQMFPEKKNISNSQHPSLHKQASVWFPTHLCIRAYTTDTQTAHVFKIANNTFSTIDSTRLKCHLQY